MARLIPTRDRLLRHVEIDGDTGCWNWTALLDPDGYGRFKDPKPTGAHRASWRVFRGTIPDGLQIDHLCRNRRCVNPDHLEPVTPAENTRRSTSFVVENAAKTQCQRGHLYDDENTYAWRGHRHCRECNRLACERYAAKRAAA